MSVDVKLATTESERETVYHLRYLVYVEESNFPNDIADHQQQRLYDSYDQACDHFLATMDGKPVGTFRMESGAQSSFDDHDRAIYDLGRFQSVVPTERMGLFSRLLVLRELRGGIVPFKLIEASARYVVEKGLDLAFLYREPHLLNLYLTIGFRP